MTRRSLSARFVKLSVSPIFLAGCCLERPPESSCHLYWAILLVVECGNYALSNCVSA